MCVQHETIEETIELDRRAGLPDQVVSLSRSPVLVSTEPDDPLPTIELKVGQDTWQMVESFDESGPADRHFMLDPELGTVTFGNGLNGRIPTSSSRTLEAKYRTSEGSRGNLASDLRWIFRKGGVGGVGLVNPNPATGGADSESLDELQLRAQASLNHSQRGVTERDLERMALGAPGVYVARAKAIADCPRRGAITVVVVPKVRPGRVGPPVDPSEAFLDAVQRHVEKLRLICDDVRVRGPAYVEVTVSARLRLLPGAGAGEPTIVRARRALDLFFATGETAPSADGGGPPSACPTRWPFGRSVFVSEVCAVLDGVPGVDAASDVLLSASLGGQAIQPDASRSIPIPGAGLVFGGAHRITVAAAARRTA
jgi:predicted phage baseplate assembly protein